MKNQTVFISPDTTMEALEEKLARAYGVIRESKDMNAICAKFAVPSLCITVLPICRTPEETNHYFFLNKNKAKIGDKFGTKKSKKNNKDQQKRVKAKTMTTTTTKSPPTTQIPPTTTPNTITISSKVKSKIKVQEDNDHEDREFSGNSNSYYEPANPFSRRRRNIDIDFLNIKNAFPPTKKSENLRRICRSDCELLENEICQKEYAIAKRHPTIGQILPLEDCSEVPDDDDCLKMGINIGTDPSDTCYWDNGNTYRGMVDKTINGKPCLKWSKVLREITHIELANNNFCRNPDSSQPKPWCYVDKQKTVELCDIAKCSDRMWLVVICALVIFLMCTMFVVLLVCCRKMKRQSVSNIQNVS
jgi:receptor tyrosine kinase-like orphan receptor 1